MPPQPLISPRWVVRFRAAEWSRDKDRALIAEGWDRFREEQVIACGIPAPNEVAARAEAMRVLRIQPEPLN